MQDKMNQARGRAQSYVMENKTTIVATLEKAERAANQQTGGRYREQLGKARRKAEQLVDRLQQPPN